MNAAVTSEIFSVASSKVILALKSVSWTLEGGISLKNVAWFKPGITTTGYLYLAFS